jgi:pimeloyl-ACP methyl ester carboxylesterase
MTPSPQLKFYNCFHNFECAKLSLPLDPFNGTHPNETVSIAIAKLPARVSVNDPRYGGPILLNPGGPGGDGASFAFVVAEALQTLVDSDLDPRVASAEGRFYDIIGFDPRGIGESEPAAGCMPDVASSWSWNMRQNEEGILGSSDAALGRHWSMTHAWGTSCKQAMDKNDGLDIKQYMNTPFVARDMLDIVEKHAAHVAQKLATIKTKKQRLQHEPDVALYEPSEAKLHYWGYSYGTVIGAYFASMFPDRVGRVVLDGVVNTDDYIHSFGNGSLADTGKTLKSFYTYCLQSGPEICPLTTSNSTIDDIRDRVHRIVQSLYHNPLPISSPAGPEVLTWSDIRLMIFAACYSPQFAFYPLAQILAAIEAGDGQALEDLYWYYRHNHVYSCKIDGSGQTADPLSMDPTFAILCSDGIDMSHTNIDDFVKYWDELEATSPMTGAIEAMPRMRCAAWKIKANYKYEGGFGANTSNPILFVSNTADPVTPLRSARIMHDLFPTSGLLVTDGAGHCSFAAPNVCTYGHIKTYFQTGVLPPPDTLCVPSPGPFSLNSTDPDSPFYDPSLKTSNVMVMNDEYYVCMNRKLHDAGLELQSLIAEKYEYGLDRLLGGSKARRLIKMAKNVL